MPLPRCARSYQRDRTDTSSVPSTRWRCAAARLWRFLTSWLLGMECPGQTFKLHGTNLKTAMMTMGRQGILAAEGAGLPQQQRLLQHR